MSLELQTIKVCDYESDTKKTAVIRAKPLKVKRKLNLLFFKTKRIVSKAYGVEIRVQQCINSSN